jgi:hypothetical protein
VSVYQDPYETGRNSKIDAYEEGRALVVVCQERHGREVKDQTMGTLSSVWDKLREGVWVPDLYADLPKVTGASPPLGIPVCPPPNR